MNKLILVLVASGGIANAGTVHGDNAEGLTHVMRYAGIAPTVTKTARTFKLAAVECVRVLDPGGNLDDYQCTLGKIELKDLAAYALYTSLRSVGAAEKPVAETKIQVSDKNVSCVFDSAKGSDERFTCTSDGIVSPPATFTPKKKPVKEIVQPVKIERQ
jgi:hypothetical protein